MRSIRRSEKAVSAVTVTALLIGEMMLIGWPTPSLTDQPRIAVGMTVGSGKTAPSIGANEVTARVIPATAAWLVTTVEAMRATATYRTITIAMRG